MPHSPVRLDLLLSPLRAASLTTAVFLDLDGTLAPIVEHPEDVAIPPDIRTLLEPLRDRYGLIALISGRSIDKLREIVSLSGVAYSGNHGRELTDKTGAMRQHPPSAQRQVAAFTGQFRSDQLDAAGVWLEDKSQTLTFHYRTAPDIKRAREFLDGVVAPAAIAAGLHAEAGKMSLEIHPADNLSKGTAALELLEREPLVEQVVSLGDDRTDVTVWRAMRARVDNGALSRFVAVGVASDETPEEVAGEADILVEGVAGTRTVLEGLLQDA